MLRGCARKSTASWRRSTAKSLKSGARKGPASFAIFTRSIIEREAMPIRPLNVRCDIHRRQHTLVDGWDRKVKYARRVLFSAIFARGIMEDRSKKGEIMGRITTIVARDAGLADRAMAVLDMMGAEYKVSRLVKHDYWKIKIEGSVDRDTFYTLLNNDLVALDD